MSEPTLTQALSSVLGAAVPSAARLSLLAAMLDRPGAAERRREDREAVVIPLAARRQSAVSVSDGPFAA